MKILFSLIKNKLFMTSSLVIIITLCIFFLDEHINFTIEYKDGKPGLLVTNKDKNSCNEIIKK